MYFTCSQDADELYGKHQEVSVQLELKYNETRDARVRASELKERATDMYTSTRTKLDRLTGKDGGRGHRSGMLAGCGDDTASGQSEGG